MIQTNSAKQAKAYYSQAFPQGEYYLSDLELPGQIHGRLADRLNIKGAITKEAFFALCENKDPSSLKRLTARTKEIRTIGYDINFHCPKSVSIVNALSKDFHIQDAFQEAVDETMEEIEADSLTRVRIDAKQDNRTTGELIWVDFLHQTSRPVDESVGDMHLHSHQFVFNATWDPVENKIKAGQFRLIKRDMPFYQARYHKRFADRLINLGYRIKRTDVSFEIDGVPKIIIEHFNKRSNQIGEVAKAKGIVSAKDKDALGAKTRAKKRKDLGLSKLKENWREQISQLSIQHNINSDYIIRSAVVKNLIELSPKQCVTHAIEHCFERASVMRDRRLLEIAYRHSLGNNTVSLDEITQQFKTEDQLIYMDLGNEKLCTTKEVLKEEKHMIDLARQGLGQLTPLYKQAPLTMLKEQQADAVSHILTTKNRISIIIGAAGTGKTTLMKEAVNLIEKAGKKVLVVAPTAEASRGVLKDEGFSHAETVAKLLIDQELQDELEDQVLWVDESGLLGTKDMVSLIDLATRKNAQLILGGDTRQHSSVVRGDALRILNTVGGIKSAEVSKIYRQQNIDYRMAVEDLSKGNVKDAFMKLDKMEFIKTIDPLNPHETLVNDYVFLLKKKKTALIISPTHKQGEEATFAIRERLRQEGLIDKKEMTALKLVNLNFTDVQKTDWRNFMEGDIIQFNQNIKKIKRGSIWKISQSKNNETIIMNDAGHVLSLPKTKGEDFDVFRSTEINLSKGDQIKITRNGHDAKKKRLNNGMTVEVVSIKKNNIKVKNKSSKATYMLDKAYGHITHAHCITSHASQGKTVDHVLIVQPSSTFPATNAKQFYVSVSRGKSSATIYTDDCVALIEHASALGDRQSAMELVRQKGHHDVHTNIQNRQEPNEQKEKPIVKKQFMSNQLGEKGYGFEL